MVSKKTVRKGVLESELRCKEHPKYRAKRVPREKCRTCWKMWFSSPNWPAPDARAVADANDWGGDDIGGRCRM